MLFAFLFFFLTIHISIYILLLRHIYISISTIFNLDYSSRRLYYCLACSFFRGETLQSEFFVRWMFYNFFFLSFRFVLANKNAVYGDCWINICTGTLGNAIQSTHSHFVLLFWFLVCKMSIVLFGWIAPHLQTPFHATVDEVFVTFATAT